MKNSGHLLVLFILTFCTSVFGQKGTQYKNDIGISFFTLGNNGFTENPELVPKLVLGTYYNRFFSNLSWISHIEFAKNETVEGDINVYDGFYGKGHMTEYTVSSGLRNTFYRQRNILIKPFLESDLYYSNVLYKAKLEGGFFGQGKIIDNTSNIYGLLIRTGIEIYPFSRIAITVSSSAKFGTGITINHVQDIKEDVKTLDFTILQIRLGYLFGK